MNNRERLSKGLPIVMCIDCALRGLPTRCPMCYDEWFYNDDDGSDFVTNDMSNDYGFCHEGCELEYDMEG